MSRIEFSLKTKRIAMERAGNRCSFPGCGIVTSGPRSKSEGVLRIGVASHIRSAAPTGPRGRGGLNDEEIRQPENCLWLCQNHGKLIDDNNGEDFSAETLISFKSLHEARIKGEVQGTYPPVGWVHSLEIHKSPLFRAGTKVYFSKLNLLYGENNSGKTTLWKYLLASFGERLLGKWKTAGLKDIDLSVDYLRPLLTKIRFRVSLSGKIRRELDGKAFAFNPLPIRVICLRDIYWRNKSKNDDRRFLAETLGLTAQDISGLVEIVNSYPYAKVRNANFVQTKEGRVLHSDVEGTIPRLSFNMLSGTEKEKVIIEFATAAARLSGQYCPTLLVLDHPFIIFKGWFDYYSHHLLDPENQFQTIMCIPTQSLDLKTVRWNGWEVVRTLGKNSNIELTQGPK
jgi:hypothetical protein